MSNSRYIQALAKNVKEHRDKKKLSQLELALKVDCSRNQISRIENCQGNPTLLLLTNLADAIGISLFELLSD